MRLKRALYWQKRIDSLPKKKSPVVWYKWVPSKIDYAIFDYNTKLEHLSYLIYVKYVRPAEENRRKYIAGDDTCENY